VRKSEERRDALDDLPPQVSEGVVVKSPERQYKKPLSSVDGVSFRQTEKRDRERRRGKEIKLTSSSRRFQRKLE